MRRRRKLDGLELMAAVAGAFLSFLDLFIGLVAMPFAGAGPMGFLRVVSITLGFELPVYIVFFYVSRKALVYACWSMYAVIYLEDCAFIFSERWFPLDALGILNTLVASIVSSEGLISLAVALLATFLFREERRVAQAFEDAQ